MLVVIAVAAIFTTINIENILAQRPTRGSFGGGGFRGGSSVHMSRGTFGRTSFGRVNYGRPVIHHVGYRGAINFGYRPYYSYYTYYRPFLGFRINVMPRGFYSFYFGPDMFYYNEGLFYRQYDNAYEVVAPPLGAEVKSLPSGSEQVVINGQNYYEFKGVYYTQKVYPDGGVSYVVAGRDGVLNTKDVNVKEYQIGDIVDQIPDGSREVTIKNEKYLVSPDDVYYEEVMDGNNVRYRVIGKLF